MSDISSALALLLLNTGVIHPYGHAGTGSELGVPVDIDWKTRTEIWRTPEKWKDARIHGGGFATQDRLAPYLQERYGPSARIANALYKLGYMSKLTLPRGAKGTRGDIENLERTTGNRYIKPLLGASIGADLLQAYNPNTKWNLRFDVPQGTPSLIFDWRF